MNEAVKLMCEQLRNNVAGVAPNEGEWRTLLGRVFEDAEGVYTDDERNELREAVKVYDRVKLLADVMSLLAKPAGKHEATLTQYDSGYYGRGLAQTIHDAKTRPRVITSASNAYTTAVLPLTATANAITNN